MATTEAADALKSIDRTLRAILVLLQMKAGIAGSEVADDQDLDGKWGDPKVNFNPRDWRGDSMKGARFSECSAEFLDLLALAFDYFAKKAEESGETYKGKPTAPYKRKDAARARGWAKRKRAGWVDRSTGEIVDPVDGNGNGGFHAASAPVFEDSEWPDDEPL